MYYCMYEYIIIFLHFYYIIIRYILLFIWRFVIKKKNKPFCVEAAFMSRGMCICLMFNYTANIYRG